MNIKLIGFTIAIIVYITHYFLYRHFYGKKLAKQKPISYWFTLLFVVALIFGALIVTPFLINATQIFKTNQTQNKENLTLTNQYTTSNPVKIIDYNKIKTNTQPTYSIEITNQAIDKYNDEFLPVSNKCTDDLNEGFRVVPQARDIETLRIEDSFVKSCIAQYKIKTAELASFLSQNKNKINPSTYQELSFNVAKDLKNKIYYSNYYIQLSDNRRMAIHQAYQTQALIDLTSMIIEGGSNCGTSFFSQNCAESLYDIYEWYYYNGGVVNTGW